MEALKLIALGIVTNLLLVLRSDPLPKNAVGIGGVFYCTKTGKLANWVIRDGKVLYPFPHWDAKQRGCLVVYKNGHWEVRIFTANEAIELTKKPDNIKLAIGGAGYFLRKGKIATYKEMAAEGLSSYVLKSRRFGFVAFKPTGQVVLGNSYGYSLPVVASILKNLGFTDALRLDGGHATTVWRSGRPFPSCTTNILVVVNPLARSN